MTSSLRPLRVFALTALALSTFAGTAHADQMGPSFQDSFGSGDVKAGFSGSARLTYCSADELAHAADHGTCVLWIPSPFGPDTCAVWLPKYPECMVNASQAYAQAKAEGSGSVTLFGTKKGVTVDTLATTKDGTSSVELIVTAGGTTLLDVDRSNVSFNVPLVLSAKKSIGLAGVGVKVQGVAALMVGANLGGGAINNGVQITATPTINALVVASADVDVAGASVGVTGKVDALDLEMPTNLRVAYANGALDYGVDADFNYTVLDGSIKVRACFLGSCESATLASYDGWSGDLSVFHDAGTLPL